MAQDDRRRRVAEIAQRVVAAAPPGWTAAQVVHRVLGGRQETELSARVAGRLVTPDPGAGWAELFAGLRGPDAPWYSARVLLAPPDHFTLDTDDGPPALTDPAVTWADAAADPVAVTTRAPAPWLAELRAAAEVAALLAERLRAAGYPPDTVGWTVDGTGWTVRQGLPGWTVRHAGTAVGTSLHDVQDAAALALGRVLLDGSRPDGTRPDPSHPADDRTVRALGTIVPTAGDPPLSLLRGVRGVTLTPGTEVDRLGGVDGNVVWRAGTPLAMRSLPADYAHRVRTVHVVARPVQALVGEAVPWFGQPGGGTAFVLARTVAELVADGALRPG